MFTRVNQVVSLAAFAPLAFGALVLGCGSTPGSEGEDGAPERAESAVAIGILVRAPEGRTTYLFADRDLPTGQIDRKKGIELPDGTFFQNETHAFFGSYEDGSITRFDVMKDYSLRETGKVSFANQGIQFINGTNLFFSSTRAFYVALEKGLIIVWDPEAMEVVGTHDVSAVLREGFNTYMGTPLKDGGRFVAPLLYVDDDWAKTETDSTVSVVFDDRTDQPITIVRDNRATGAFTGFTGTGGYSYLLGDALGGLLAIAHSEHVKSPTLLRMAPRADELDKDYSLDLGALLGTRGLQGLWPVSGNKFVVQAWANEVDPADVLKTPDDFWTAPYFDWKIVDALTREVTDVVGIERSAPYSLVTFELDGSSFLQRYTAVGDVSGSAEFFELEADGKATLVATTAGEFWFLGRVNGAAK